MRLYVRTLEEEVADWWPQHVATASNGDAVLAPANGGGADGEVLPSPATEALAAAAANTEAASPEASSPPQRLGTAAPPLLKTRSVAEVVVEGSWVSPYISSDRRPPPRYEHATSLVGSELVIVGGNYGEAGRGRGRKGAGRAPPHCALLHCFRRLWQPDSADRCHPGVLTGGPQVHVC